MDPLQDFETWFAIADAVSLDVTQFTTFIDGFDLLLGLINQNGFLPDNLQGQTNFLIYSIKTKFVDRVLSYGVLNNIYIFQVFNLLTIFLKFSLYGISIGDGDIIAIGQKIIEGEQLNVFLHNQNLFHGLMKNFSRICEEEQIIENAFYTRIDTISAFSQLCPFIRILFRYCDDIDYLKFLQIAIQRLKAILGFFGNSTSASHIQIIIKTFIDVMPSQPTDEMIDLFIQSFMPIVISFILQVNQKIEQSYYAFCSLQDILNSFVLCKKAMDFIIQSSDFQALKEIQFTEKISEGLKVFYSKLAQLGYLDAQSILGLWNQHITIHISEMPLFLETIMCIISKARNDALDAIIQKIISEKGSLSNWLTIITNISNNLKCRADTQEQQYQLRDCIWEDCFNPEANQKESQKAFLSIIPSATDANAFESISIQVLSGNLDSDTLNFAMSALNTMLNSSPMELSQDLVNNLINYALHHLFSNKDQQNSVDFLSFIPLICSKQTTLLSQDQLMMVASHRSDFDGFFNLITELYQKGVIDPTCLDILIDKLAEQPDIGFFNFFKIVCHKENNMNQPYKRFPLEFEDKLWKYCLTDGVARQSFNELLCILYANNDTRYISDDSMINHFFYNFDEFRTGIKKINEDAANLPQDNTNDEEKEENNDEAPNNQNEGEESKIIVKSYVKPTNAPISPYLTQLLITFVSFIEDEQNFTKYARDHDLMYINPDKMKTELKVIITNVYTRETKVLDFSKCATVGTLIIDYSETCHTDPSYIQVNKSGTLVPLNRRILLENLRDSDNNIKVDVMRNKYPVIFHKRTTLPISIIAAKKYENIYLKDMIDYNSEPSFRFLTMATVNPVLWQPYAKLCKKPDIETIDTYFNLDKIYYMCYNMNLFYFYLNTQQSVTFAEVLSKSNFFFHIAKTIYAYITEKASNNQQINPIINDIILYYTKSFRRYPIPFTEKEFNDIYKICLQIASLENLFFQSRLKILETMNYNGNSSINKILIPFPDDFYDTFISLIMNPSMRLRQQSESTLQRVVFPPSVFYETLISLKQKCSNEFLHLMQTHIMNFKPFAEELVAVLLECVSITNSFQRKCFIEVLNVCLQKEKVSNNILLKIQHFFIDTYLKFDLSSDDTNSFSSAINVILKVSNIVTPVQYEGKEEIVYENKLYNKLLSFHTDRLPLGEYEIDGDKCLQRNGRSGLKKYGQTCYLNSTLQMLFTLPRIRKMIINQDCSNTMISKLHELFTIMMYTNKKSISTRFFVDNCIMFENDYFSPNEQQDAAEFLGSVLDKLCTFDEYKETIKHLAQCQIEHITQGLNDTNYKTTTSDDFFLFSLELSNSLETSFHNLIQPNYFTKQNQYYAQEFQAKIDAKRFSRIKRSPPNLFIALNRFKYNLQKRMREKISTECTIPLTLDISKYMTDDSDIRPKPYKLKAAIVHKGTAASGHYICYVKKPGPNRMWLKCDESEVSIEKEEDFLVAANGKTQEATGYIFAYSQDPDDENTDDDEVTTPVNTKEYHPDAKLFEAIQQENEKNHKCSLFCSTGYKNLILNLANATDPQFYDICLRYCCDTAPYLTRYFSEKNIYQTLSKSLSNSKELSTMFFDYCQPFIRDIFIYSKSMTVQNESANLFRSLCLSEAISTSDLLQLILQLVPGLFECYDSAEPVFRVIRKITFINDSIKLLDTDENKNLLISFITEQFQKYLVDNPQMKRSYILDGLNLSSYLKIISSLNFPKENYEILYDHRFFVDMMGTKSKPQSLAHFILKFFDVQTYIDYFTKNTGSIKCHVAASILYFLIPNEATKLLLASSFNREEVANEIIENVKQRKKHNITKYLLNNADLWIIEYLLSTTHSLRIKGVQIAAAVCQSKQLIKYAEEEEEEYEEDQSNNEEEDSIDERRIEQIQNDSGNLLIQLLNCAPNAVKLLETIFIMTQRRNDAELLHLYIQVIYKLLMTVADPSKIIEQIQNQDIEEKDKSCRAVSEYYGLEKLEILCKPIGQFCTPFSLQGMDLLSIFSLYYVPITDDVILQLINSEPIESKQDSSKFSKYLFYIYGILNNNPEKKWSLLIQYLIEQVLFNKSFLFQENYQLVNNITQYIKKYYLPYMQAVIDRKFESCATNNFALTLDVCYETQTKEPFISNLIYALYDVKFQFTLDVAKKLTAVSSDTSINKDIYDRFKGNLPLNCHQDAIEYLVNYIDANITIIQPAPMNFVFPCQGKTSDDGEENEEKIENENKEIDKKEIEQNNNANDDEIPDDNHEDKDTGEDEQIGPPELIDEDENSNDTQQNSGNQSTNDNDQTIDRNDESKNETNENDQTIDRNGESKNEISDSKTENNDINPDESIKEDGAETTIEEKNEDQQISNETKDN